MFNVKSGNTKRYFGFLRAILLLTVLILSVPYFVRVFICDQFVVPSDSMTPTLIVGDRILVDKLIAGARIYKKFEFGKDIPLRSFRMPGIRKVRVNDVVVFNAPRGYDRSRIEFRINYVYSKRCVGTPGDSVSVREGYFCNNRYSRPIGNPEQQRRLAETPDSLIHPKVLRAMPYDDRRFGWTIKNFGPLYVPQAGARIELDWRNYKLYKLVIEYETGGQLKYTEDRALLDGQPLPEYTFRNDYYFFCGDNVSDSKDSRYLGFVPEEFIIGVVRRISYSEDPYTHNRRSGRWWKRVE